MDKFGELEKKLQVETARVALFRGMNELVNSPHWEWLKAWVLTEMDGATEREETEPDVNIIYQYIGMRKGLRKILQFPEGAVKLKKYEERVDKLRKEYAAALDT